MTSRNMPTRKKSNLAYHSRSAKRMRLSRSSKTTVECNNKIYQARRTKSRVSASIIYRVMESDNKVYLDNIKTEDENDEYQDEIDNIQTEDEIDENQDKIDNIKTEDENGENQDEIDHIKTEDENDENQDKIDNIKIEDENDENQDEIDNIKTEDENDEYQDKIDNIKIEDENDEIQDEIDNIQTADENDEIDIYVLIEIEDNDADLGNFAFVDCNVDFGFTQSEVHESQDHLKRFYSIFSKFKDVDNGYKFVFTNLYPNFNCFKCRLSFTSQEALDRHCQQHPREVIYDCDMCKKSYISSENLALHKLRCQAERYCTHCNRSFASVKTLKTHIGLVHAPREKRYQCGTCDRRFVHPGILENHLRKQSCARSYRCKVCNRNYMDEAMLNKHSITHLSVNRFKTIGNVDFSKTTRVTYARRNYSRLATKVQLIQHQSEHSEYETYRCTTCPKKFVSETSLKLHQRTHSAV